MPKPERGSLSVIKRALPNLPQTAPPKELETRILSGDDPTGTPDAGAATAVAESQDGKQAVHSDVQHGDVHPESVGTADVPATRLVPRPGKRKEPVQMVTYRIPASLYDRLFRIAEYNNLNMTDIVVEAIERHLPNFPQPR